MISNRPFRFKLFILLCICHIFLLLALISAKTSRQNKIAPVTFMHVSLLKKAALKPPATAHKSKPSFQTNAQKAPRQVITETKAPTPNEVPDNLAITAPIDTPPPSAPLRIDLKAITLSMKDEFNKKDVKPRKKAFQEFGEALDDASLVNHTGTKIVKRFAYDGRPVSKVITPFGTYCIRHPKAGENPELTPPALPVSCGRL